MVKGAGQSPLIFGSYIAKTLITGLVDPYFRTGHRTEIFRDNTSGRGFIDRRFKTRNWQKYDSACQLFLVWPPFFSNWCRKQQPHQVFLILAIFPR